MEFTAATLITFVKQIGDWGSGILKHQSNKKKEYIEALYSVLDALTITRSYLSYQKRTGERDRDKEEALSMLWNSASKGLRAVEAHDLADKCSLKGFYWADPEDWSDDDYPDAEIEVEKVFHDTQSLLDNIK
jgi:hypothetical protein